MKEFCKDLYIYEYYNVIIGDGDDVNCGDGKLKFDVFYFWGVVLFLLVCEELICFIVK